MNKKLLFPILISPIILSSCNSSDALATSIKRSVFGCGTLFNIQAYNVKEEAVRTAEDLISEYSTLFDGFESYGNIVNIKKINETNEEIKVSKKLFDALKVADDFYKKTNGYFNPYIGELTYAYKESYKENKLPAQQVINDALNNLKTFKFILNEENLTVQRQGKSLIDLGAFSKGYILDVVKEELKDKKVDNYMVSGGGSSNYFTSKPGNKPFKAGISYLKGKYVELTNESLGVSGIFEQYIELNGIKYSHIINPFTGLPVLDYDFSMVIHESNTFTDVFSTTLMVAESKDVIDSFKDKYDFKYMIYKDSKCVYESGDIKLISY